MSKTQPITESTISDNRECPHCKTLLPSYALFCSSCGKQVDAKKNEEKQKHAENDNHNAREQDDDTVRTASISQKHLKGRQSSQPPKNNKKPRESEITTTLLRASDVEVQTPLLPSLPEAECSETELEDTQTRLEVPFQSVPLQSLPTTPNPARLGIMETVPDTEVPTSLEEVPEKRLEESPISDKQVGLEEPGHTLEELNRLSTPLPITDIKEQEAISSSLSGLFWPMIITFSALAAGLVNFVFADIAIRPIIVFWFLFVCPGMMVVRFLRLKEPTIEWTLALALSFVIDALVAGIQLYAGKWSPTTTLIILIGLSISGAIVQLATRGSISHAISKLPRIVRSRILGILFAIFLAILTGLGIIVGFWSRVPNHFAIPQPTVRSSASASTHAPTSAPTTYLLIAGPYNGTIVNLSSNVSTSLSLTRVRQSQGKITGYLVLGSGLQGSGPFSGTIDTTKHLQFTVMDATGHATFFFDGAMQSATTLSGDYYQCSPNSTQNSQCIRATSGYGIWSVVLLS